MFIRSYSFFIEHCRWLWDQLRHFLISQLSWLAEDLSLICFLGCKIYLKDTICSQSSSISRKDHILFSWEERFSLRHNRDVQGIRQGSEPPWTQTYQFGPDLGRSQIRHSTCVLKTRHAKETIYGTVHVSLYKGSEGMVSFLILYHTSLKREFQELSKDTNFVTGMTNLVEKIQLFHDLWT